jgi:hypothetical protein
MTSVAQSILVYLVTIVFAVVAFTWIVCLFVGIVRGFE